MVTNHLLTGMILQVGAHLGSSYTTWATKKTLLLSIILVDS